MSRSFRGCPPYEGSDPYLYLCFAEQDREAVFPLLRHLYSRGCRIWYSLENTADLEKLDRQQERMNGASLVVLYLTDNVREAGNVKNSLLYYQQHGKPVISIDTDDGDNELSVGLTAAAKHIDGRAGRTAEDLETELIRTEGFSQELIGDPPKKKGVLRKAAAVMLAVALLVAGAAYYGYTALGWFVSGPEQAAATETPEETPETKEPEIPVTEEPTEIPTESPTPEPTPAPTPEEAAFEDQAFAEALRALTPDGFLTEKNLENFTELELARLPEDPAELEKLPNLEKLVLPQREAMKAESLLDTGITIVLRPEGEVSP